MPRLAAFTVLAAFLPVLALAQEENAGLPLPSATPLIDYERSLFPFIAEREFAELGWKRDKGWRNTGPFVLNASYGVHPAVRIYYSPEIIAWLEGGREGVPPDGAMIVKEMAHPPAERYTLYRDTLEVVHPGDPDRVEAEMLAFLRDTGGLSWTVMVRDGAGSHDGWFYASVGQSAEVDSFDPPFVPPAGGAADGICMRCHASADGAMTFVTLQNVEGYPGDPSIFRVDESWRDMAGFPAGPFNLPVWQRPAGGMSEQDLATAYFHDQRLLADSSDRSPSPTGMSPIFVEMFPPEGGIAVGPDQIATLPSQWLDRVPARPGAPQHFLTSDNCVGCHGGLGGPPAGIAMFLQTGPDYGDGYDISEYGEWRWSPMGLAGRDPIFFAQLESEFALLKAAGAEELTANLGTTCLSCHGAMGQRQLSIDAHADPAAGLDANDFKTIYTELHAPLTAEEREAQEAAGTYAYHQYGALAREGISCTICHRIEPPQQAAGESPASKLDTYLMNGTTGVFRMAPSDTLNGPFRDVRERPMENSLGITPVYSEYVNDSELCGACHTINLPNVDADPNRPLAGYTDADQDAFNQAARNGAAFLKETYGVDFPEPLTQFQHSIEQSTYLEWVNSVYSEEETLRSCQSCHMKTHFESVDGTIRIENLAVQIATIQDTTLPDVENLLPSEEIDVPVRQGYKRHNFVGLNAFLVEMIRQFSDEMGVATLDPMTYAKNGAQLSLDTMALQARDETSDLSLDVSVADPGLVATVEVTNKTGHRLPSGVGFRRMFLEVRAAGPDGETLWCSGCSNEAGVIVGRDGEPLLTEFLDHVPDGAQTAIYQPHHRHIDREDQAQIYEELTQNARGEFTTSFVHRVSHPKDNRLNPVGTLMPGSPEFAAKFGDSGITSAFMKATVPEGLARDDPDFVPGRDRTDYRIRLPEGINPASVEVTATLYYQAIPPYYLKQRFTIAPEGQATQRLYYLASRLETAGTLIEGWKLRIASAEARAE